MRSERKKGRAFLARFMVLLMIINLLSGINPNTVRADEQHFNNNGQEVNSANGIILKETASNYNNGEFDVEMLIKGSGSTQTENKNLDVVLVVDRSGSMKDYGRMENAKKAAKEFVDNLLKDNGGNNVRVGLVSYAGNNGAKYSNPVLEAVNLQKDKNNLKNIINNYQPYEGYMAGTFTQAGLRKANELFDNNTNKKIIVLISDGEPTYAYSAKQLLDYKQIHKADSDTPKAGYEIWSRGERHNGSDVDKKSWKKGYKTGTYETGSLWWKKTWNWTPYYVKLVPDPEVVGDGKYMDTIIQNNTISEATAIKNSGVEVFSVGIGVNDSGKYVLSQVASPNRYYASDTYAGDLAKILKELHNVIISYNIVNGSLEIQMNDKVDFKNKANFSDLSVEVVKTNYSDVSQEERDSFDKRKAEIKDKSNWNWNPTSKVLTLKNITLGEKEELKVTYKAELKEEWKDGTPYPLSQTAKLNLKALTDSDNRAVNFIIPTVKDEKTVNLKVNKTWDGKVPESVANGITFKVNPSPDGKQLQVTVKPNGWSGELNDIPKYKNGEAITYTISEPVSSDYKVISPEPANGQLSGTKDDAGNWKFDVKNKNTEKTSLVVIKNWVTADGKEAPADLKFAAKVQLYNGITKVGNPVAFDNGKAEFTGLDKYNTAGDLIDYTVKEVNEKGEEESSNKITNGKFNYEVTYKYYNNSAVVTNKVTNPEAQTFDINLKKAWKGGVGNEAEFVFTNSKDANNPITKTLKKAEDNFGEDSIWEKKVTLPKYNNDGSKARYTVTESAKGFNSSNVNPTTVDANVTIVEATNTRNTKDITVTKVWEKTPKELETDITVDLYENDVKSNNSKKIVKGKYQTTFENLPATKEDGTPIKYTFREAGEDAGNITFDNGEKFDVGYDDTTHTITNTYKNLKDKMIEVTLTKKWVGPERESAIFNFVSIGDNTGIAPKKVTLTKGNWQAEVSLRKYNDDGKLAKYKVTEDTVLGFVSNAPDGIEVTKDGQKVEFTNTQVTGKLTIVKKWIGAPEAGKEVTFTVNPNPNNQEFKLTKNDATSDNTWSKEFKLPIYDLNGKAIEYTVTEKTIEGYQAEKPSQTFNFVIPDSDDKVITFKNTAVTTGNENTYTIIKNWQGQSADSAYFGLFDDRNNRISDLIDSDGKSLGDIIVLSPNSDLTIVVDTKWTRTIKLAPLPKVYDDGKPRTYIFKEMTVPDTNGTNQAVENGGEVQLGNRTYKVTYVSNNNTFEFTNTDVTKANITVTKKWDGTPQQGLSVGLFKKSDLQGTATASPTTSAVQAIQGTKTEETITFSDINLTDASGQNIDYVARELDADGNILEENSQLFEAGGRTYKVSYDENNVITNTELIKITVNKIWGDNVPEIAKREIKFRVLGGYLTGGTLSAKNDWTWTSGYLPLYDIDNNKINYSVVETEINGEKIDLNQGFAKDTDGNTVYYHKAFKITLEGAKDITESKTVKITNSIKDVEQPDDLDKRNIRVVKTWVNATQEQKKEVKVTLYRVDPDENGNSTLKKVNDLTLNSGNDWIGEFKNVERYVKPATPSNPTKPEEQGETNTSPTTGADNGEVEEKPAVEPTPAAPAVSNEPIARANKNANKVKAMAMAPDPVRYVVIETEIDGKGFENTTPDEYTNDYELNGYKVSIESDLDKGGNTVFVFNEPKEQGEPQFAKVIATKVWADSAKGKEKPVVFTLYCDMDNKWVATDKTVTLSGENNNWTAVFDNLPEKDEHGESILYYVFETKIGDTVIENLPNALSENVTYTTGTIDGGKYTVNITVKGNEDSGDIIDKVTITNSYTANTNPGGGGGVNPGGGTGGGDNPGGSNPGTEPVVPVPDPTLTPTPDTTPTVDVPDDTTPQGDANINPDTDNDAEDTDDADDDDILEVDNDDVPQGTAKTKDDAVKEDPIDVDGDPTPRGNANLPKTGGTTADFLSIIGLGLVGLGLVIKRRK